MFKKGRKMFKTDVISYMRSILTDVRIPKPIIDKIMEDWPATKEKLREYPEEELTIRNTPPRLIKLAQSMMEGDT